MFKEIVQSEDEGCLIQKVALCVGIIKCPPNPNQNLTKLQFMKFLDLRGDLVMPRKIAMNLIMLVY